MTISLTRGGTSVEISDDLTWADEFDWQPVEVSTQRSVTGALIVETAIKQAGRPITLSGGQAHGWLTRAQVLALRALAAVPSTTPITLQLRGTVYTVAFAAAGVAAQPVLDYSNPAAGDFYIVTLSLIEV